MKIKRSVVAIACLSAVALACPAQHASVESPADVVNRLWKAATEGGLLTKDGWERTRGLFKDSPPWPGDATVRVVSNVWGPAGLAKAHAASVEIIVGFQDAGQIDASLRYSPPKNSEAIKSGEVFHLAKLPTHYTTYKSDGRSLAIDKEIAGPPAWQITDQRGTPFTTVNTAIRYVLEMRNKTADPVLKRNADETIRRLLELN
jgi:hypothetical protein